ncbi:hypothetical protein TIFTF001_001773 [Ficus carica]|uniref:Uncharacterized protein n=1 Tax=Ficus carica TaxID=3494 RepID=A0AA87Z328_FICCA|nr:hypothetical protein TIFTF001_001773 [Ficus carica]
MNHNLANIAIFSHEVVADLVEEIAILELVATDLTMEIAIQRRSQKLANRRMSRWLAVKDRSSRPKES